MRVKSEDEVRALTFFALLYIGVSAISRPFSVIRHDQLVNKRQKYSLVPRSQRTTIFTIQR